MHRSVDVIIPTYKPDGGLISMIEILEEQSFPVNKIIIINTEEKYFYKLFYGTVFLEQYRNTPHIGA